MSLRTYIFALGRMSSPRFECAWVHRSFGADPGTYDHGVEGRKPKDDVVGRDGTRVSVASADLR